MQLKPQAMSALQVPIPFIHPPHPAPHAHADAGRARPLPLATGHWPLAFPFPVPGPTRVGWFLFYTPCLWRQIQNADVAAARAVNGGFCLPTCISARIEATFLRLLGLTSILCLVPALVPLLLGLESCCATYRYHTCCHGSLVLSLSLAT
jgi:hypothetical protein